MPPRYVAFCAALPVSPTSSCLRPPFSHLCLPSLAFSQVSQGGKQLLEDLLDPKPEERLGARYLEDLFTHIFFEGFNFASLEVGSSQHLNRTPPP